MRTAGGISRLSALYLAKSGAFLVSIQWNYAFWKKEVTESTIVSTGANLPGPS